MTHIERAIRDAMEKGGYKDGIASHEPWSAYRNRAFLDPEWWSALGKARGWSEESVKMNGRPMEIWLLHWHEFIDHLESGADAESFFASLATRI